MFRWHSIATKRNHIKKINKQQYHNCLFFSPPLLNIAVLRHQIIMLQLYNSVHKLAPTVSQSCI